MGKPTSPPLPLNPEGLEHFARRARLHSNFFHTCECASCRRLLSYRTRSFLYDKKTWQNFFYQVFLYVRERIRTPDTLVRSQVLYPAELRTHILLVWLNTIFLTYYNTFVKCVIGMPATGIEPVLCRHNRILSPARLPVPPRRHLNGTYRARTYDPLLVRQMLSQLS